MLASTHLLVHDCFLPSETNVSVAAKYQTCEIGQKLFQLLCRECFFYFSVCIIVAVSVIVVVAVVVEVGDAHHC